MEAIRVKRKTNTRHEDVRRKTSNANFYLNRVNKG